METDNKLQFEWDSEKETANFRKHSVHFMTARFAFTDLECIERYDAAHSNGEKRFQLIGKAAERLLFVVYTFRGSNIRLISARPADREEKELYLLLMGNDWSFGKWKHRYHRKNSSFSGE